MSEFKFYKHQDSAQNDLFCVGRKSIDELKEICKKNDRCVAFNSFGYMKYDIVSEAQFIFVSDFVNDDDGLYVFEERLNNVRGRNRNKCHISFEDYNFYPNLDSYGNDLGRNNRLSIEELKELADKNEKCKGFNTFGFLKHKIEHISTFGKVRNGMSGEGLYVKKIHDPNSSLLSKNIQINVYPSLRIKLLCNWCNSQTLREEWNHMSKGNYKWNNIEITCDDNADFYVIINKSTSGEYYNPLRTIIFHMEPWCPDSNQKWGIKTWGEWAKPDESKFLQVRSHNTFINNCFWQFSLTYDQLKFNNFKKTKQSIISTICSSKYFDPGHIKRIDFLKFVEAKNDPLVQIEIYNTDNKHNFKNYMGPHPVGKKETGMLPYKYYFMGENNEEHNFITEKLWEPLITDTLCFYWGCPNVSDHIDPKTYILLDLDDFEKSFNIIKEAIQRNAWENSINHIRKEKHMVLDYYNFYPTLERVLFNEFKMKSKMTDDEVLYHKYFKDILGENISKICFFHNCFLDKGPEIFKRYINKFV
ncbi:MAG: glycosyltransferase family 10, partial [Nitrososphaeraceae archaeon]|nr:glycosyltransferase family 10 [Nitrososphaeraceae archaeon]